MRSFTMQTCPFFHNVEEMSGPKRSIRITDHFTCTSANVKVEINDKDVHKSVARHFNLPNHSKEHMAVCSLSLHLGSSESRKI